MRVFVALILVVQLSFGCEIRPVLWSPSPTADALFRFERGNKAGFIDSTGKIVVQPKFPADDADGEFSGGLLSLGNSSGPFIDATGKQVLGDELDRVWDFHEGLAAALKAFGGSSPWGYIDRTGAWAISPRFPSYPGGLVSDFSEGRAAIEMENKVGYVDRTGQFVIPLQFAAGKSFSDGAAVVAISGPCSYAVFGGCFPSIKSAPFTGPSANRSESLPACRWSYIDKSGQRLFDADFEEAGDFHEGLAAVQVAGKWGYVDKRGIFLVTPRYLSAEPFSGGLAFVNDGTMSGFINSAGVLQFTAKTGAGFSEGVTFVGDRENGFTFVDKNGRQVIREAFELADRFFHGLAHVKLRGYKDEFAYIDHTGRHVFTYRGRM